MAKSTHRPPPGPASPVATTDLEHLIAEGRLSRPLRAELPEPLKLPGDPDALSRALDEIRDESG